MKKTLLLALALTSLSLAGCTDEGDTTEIAPVVPVETADPMMADTTMMMDDGMMADSTAMMDNGTSMEGDAMMADSTTNM